MSPTTWREAASGSLEPWRQLGVPRVRAERTECTRAFVERYPRRPQAGNRALAEDIAGTARLQYTPFAGASLCASFFAGDAGQAATSTARSRTVHAALGSARTAALSRARAPHARHVRVDRDADVLSRALEDTIAETSFVFYAEASYTSCRSSCRTDALSGAVFRYELFDTQDAVPRGSNACGERRPALHGRTDYKPHPHSRAEARVPHYHPAASVRVADEVNVGAGFVF